MRKMFYCDVGVRAVLRYMRAKLKQELDLKQPYSAQTCASDMQLVTFFTEQILADDTTTAAS